MSGRKPNPVLAKHVDKRYSQLSIVPSNELWVLTYQDQPVKIKRDSLIVDMVAKYSLEVFTSQNKANKRAAQMNTRFHSKDFGSKKLL